MIWKKKIIKSKQASWRNGKLRWRKCVEPGVRLWNKLQATHLYVLPTRDMAVWWDSGPARQQWTSCRGKAMSDAETEDKFFYRPSRALPRNEQHAYWKHSSPFIVGDGLSTFSQEQLSKYSSYRTEGGVECRSRWSCEGRAHNHVHLWSFLIFLA